MKRLTFRGLRKWGDIMSDNRNMCGVYMKHSFANARDCKIK